MLWLDIVMYQAFVLRTNLLGKFFCSCIAEKATASLLPLAFLTPLQLLFAAHSALWGGSPTFWGCPQPRPTVPLPWGVPALSRAWAAITLMGFAPSLTVNPFSLGCSYQKPPQLLAGVEAVAEGVRMHRQPLTPFPPRGCPSLPPALILPLEMGLKRLSLLFPSLGCISYCGIFLEISEPFWILSFFSHQFNDRIILARWETLSCHSIRFSSDLPEAFSPHLLSGLFFSHWHRLFVFSCSFSPQGSLWPYYLSFCIFIFLCVFPPLASLLHCTPCSCSLCAWYLLHTLCSFIFSL